jgi:hypothetical protein
MLKPTTHQYSAALHNADAENAKLNQKIAQLDALEKGIYVRDDLIAVGTLVHCGKLRHAFRTLSEVERLRTPLATLWPDRSITVY